MRFSFPYSHAFHGGRVTVDVSRDQGGPSTIEFGDGTVLIGACRRDGDAFLLSLPAYQTVKGTGIPAKDWRIVQVLADTWKAESA